MQIKLDKLFVDLRSDSAELATAWERLFEGWSVEAPESSGVVPTVLELQLVSDLPEPPTQSPTFRHTDGILEVYQTTEQETLLRFPGAAQVSLDVQGPGGPIRGSLREATLRREQLEDIILTCLAPRLRRQGTYLLHAAALAQYDEAILLVGPSGSGKTTTALNLALSGRHLLANDAVMLTERDGQVAALATPGDIRLRSGALRFLTSPGVVETLLSRGSQTTVLARAGPFGVQTNISAPVRRIYFLRVTDDHRCRVSSEQPAIALARLCEQSVDRWDKPALTAHLDFLHRLSRQASSYLLELGTDVSDLADLVAGN